MKERFADILLLALGAALIFFAAYAARVNYRLESQGLRAPGKIVRVTPAECGNVLAELMDIDDFAECHSPIVEFADSGGKTVTFKNGFVARRNKYETGSQAQVIYLVADPEHTAIIGDVFSMWFDAVVYLLFGGAFAAAGGVRFRQALLRRRRAAATRHIRRRASQPVKYRRREHDSEEEPGFFQLGIALLCIVAAVVMLARAWLNGK